MFKADNATAEVKRYVYVDGKATGKETVCCYTGYLTLIDSQDLSDPSLYGKMYHFNTEPDADIKESDDIQIGDDKYSVKVVIHKKGYTLGFTRVVMVKDA